jgi:hypothetical protein
MKKFNIVRVEGSSDLNRILKDQKKLKDKVNILYVSLWDSCSTDLVSKLESYEDSTKTLYVVDTFNTPHGTGIFGINKLPAFISLKDRVKVEDYLPNVHRLLGV